MSFIEAPSDGRVETGTYRREDLRLITGRGRYVGDIRLPDMLHAHLVRSTEAHATIRRIDVSAAAALPGVSAAVTAADLEIPNVCPLLAPHPGLSAPTRSPLLAGSSVHYVGQPVAVIVANDRYRAEDAAELVEIEYESRPVCADIAASLRLGAPQLHAEAPSNIAGGYCQQIGEVDERLAAAELRLQLSLSIACGTAVPMETRGVVASAQRESLTVWSNTQRPHGLLGVLRSYLPQRADQLRVVSPDTGGGFGVKSLYYPEEILVPWLAERLARSVAWIEDRAEHFVATAAEPTLEFDVDVGFSRTGRVLALAVDFRQDLGAFAAYGFVVAQNAANHLIGPYDLSHVRASWQGVYTNKVPTGTYRGAGRPQGVYVIERVMDQIAAELCIDKAEVRRRNLLAPGRLPHDTGLRTPIGAVTYASGNYPALMERALSCIDYAGWRSRRAELRAGGRLVGIGLGNYVECSMAEPGETVQMSLGPDGSIEVSAGFSAQGQGHETTLAAVAARALGVECEEVRVVLGDTALTPFSVGTYGSRIAIVASGAICDAARRLRDLATELAAEAVGLEPQQLYWEAGAIRRIDGTVVLTRAELTKLVGERCSALSVAGSFVPSEMYTSSGSHVAVVEVLPARCAVQLLDYVIVHDSGRALDAESVRGQILGGFVQGLGGALFEELRYDIEGQLVTGSLMSYLLPLVSQIRLPTIVELPTDSPSHDLGVKGSGESGLMPVYAAIAGAVEDTLGLRVERSPVTRGYLASLLAESGGQG